MLHVKYKGNVKKLGPDDILVIEGIHGLNEKMSYSLPAESKFKIYISALTQLAIDVADSFLLAVGSILLESIEDDAVVGCLGIFLMNKDRRYIASHNLLDSIFIKQTLAFQNNLVTLNGYYFACILIDEVFRGYFILPHNHTQYSGSSCITFALS